MGHLKGCLGSTFQVIACCVYGIVEALFRNSMQIYEVTLTRVGFIVSHHMYITEWWERGT